MSKTLTGTVVSKKTDKTFIVSTQIRKTHPLYKKQYLVTKRYAVHDDKNAAKTGDKVQIEETRPISATKHHKLLKILEKALIREDQTVEAVTAEEKPDEVKVEQPEKPKVKKAAK